jgi:3-oxoacyl-[acyl-carrier protein] reductase
VKTFLVTGGSRGIGRSVVERLARDGHAVAFTYATSKDAADAVVGIDPARIAAFQSDIRDRGVQSRLVDSVRERFDTIDGLVNNAGVRRDALMYNMTDDQWNEVLDTNLHGVFSLTRAVLALMLGQRSGSIVNVASLSGLHGVVGQVNYSAAKGGLIAMTRSLARETARSGIRVNCVAPGLVDTDMLAGMEPDVKREMIRAIPMRRAVKAEEVASTIAFLLGDEATAITGQVLNVDGGTSA